MPYVQTAKLGVTAGAPAITETDPNGAGTVTFAPAGPCEVFQPGQKPISWLTNQRCADGAILTTDAAGAVTAHLVELKTTVKLGNWDAIKQQLEGMLHNVRALCAVKGAPLPSQLRAYVAYVQDALSNHATAAPVLLKAPLGGAPPVSVADWEAGQISLLEFQAVPLIKIARDANGDGQGVLQL